MLVSNNAKSCTSGIYGGGRVLPFITYAYALAAFFVILGHSHPIHQEYPSFITNLVVFIYSFHMPLFFFISGILIEYTSDNRRFLPWWGKKVKKLLIPYVVLSLVAFLPKILLSGVVTDDMSLMPSNIIKLIFMPRAGIWGHFWFIPTFLMTSAIGAIFCKMPWPTRCVMIVCSLVLASVPIDTAWLCIKDVCLNTIYVLVGICVSDYVTTNYQKLCSWKLFTCAAILGAALFLLTQICPEGIVRRFVGIFCGLGLLTSVLIFAIMITLTHTSFLKFVGKHAFTIFIYSWPAQAAIEMLCAIVFKFDWYITFACMFIGGLAFPLLLIYLYTNHIKRNKYLDALIGLY